MKRGMSGAFFILGFLMTVLFVPANVFAYGCEDGTDLQKILGISTDTNAHSELYDQTNYPVEICYDYFFIGEYGGETPHACNSNIVAKISASTNAHAEGPTGTTYGTNVCYGDLQCQIVDHGAGQTCNGRGAFIMGFSGATNAHVSAGTCSNYQYYLCCTSASGEPKCNYNGICDYDETNANCPDDCPCNTCNNDDICLPPENYTNCMHDCHCGNGKCEWYWPYSETNETGNCLGPPEIHGGDCWCGDGICETLWENVTTCRDDCYGCQDGRCDRSTENVTICTDDCCEKTYEKEGSVYDVAFCDDYDLVAGDLVDKEDMCTNDPYCANVAQTNEWYRAISEHPGSQIFNPRCVWDGASCTFAFDATVNGVTASCSMDYKDAPACQEDQDVREVNFTVKNLSGTYDQCRQWCDTPTEPHECTQTLPCPRVIKLPFFTLTNFFIALMGVIILYAVVRYFKIEHAVKH